MELRRCNREKTAEGYKFTLEVVVKGKGSGVFVEITTPEPDSFKMGVAYTLNFSVDS